MSYRSHSVESNGSSVEDGEEHQRSSLMTPSYETMTFLQGNGGKGMRTLEVEHVGLGAEVEGRVW